jgi:glyoxylase-like metal-dependent hydrolase (beta-lactamase superfamily II)
VPIEGPHEGDRQWIEQLDQQGRMFGLGPSESFEPDRWLVDGDRVQVGDVEFDVRHCPGHTPGHVIFYSPRDRVAFVGDVLFAGSIGRTDFPGGDYDTLIRSIRNQLFVLGDDVRFVPGHGPMSTFGDERRGNPFVGDAALGVRPG